MTVSIWLFILAVAGTVALFTVLFQTLKASVTDPVDSLRYE